MEEALSPKTELMDFLQKIVQSKKEQIEENKKKNPLEKLQELIEGTEPCRDWKGALKKGADGLKIIAEIKRASPSRGDIARDIVPEAIALEYEQNGAVALSVLTDPPFFHGSLADLEKIKDVVKLPVLRKDFIIDPYQVYESRVCGADAILLIMTLLTEGDAKELLELARSLGLSLLTEVHSEEELERAVQIGAEIIGINNRDLKTFTVDRQTTLRLLPSVPKGKIVVSESGFYERGELLEFRKRGVDAFLIGEALMTSGSPGKKLAELLQEEEAP